MYPSPRGIHHRSEIKVSDSVYCAEGWQGWMGRGYQVSPLERLRVGESERLIGGGSSLLQFNVGFKNSALQRGHLPI